MGNSPVRQTGVVLAWVVGLLLMAGCAALTPAAPAVPAAQIATTPPPVDPTPTSGAAPVALDPTAQPESSLADPGLTPYQGNSGYGPGFPDFTLAIDPNTWRLEVGREDRVVLRQDDACMVQLTAGGGMMATTLELLQLGGREWRLYDTSSPQVVAYSTLEGTGAYLFFVALPAPYSAETKQPCQAAVEALLTTFSVLDTVSYRLPLPDAAHRTGPTVTFTPGAWTVDDSLPLLYSQEVPGCALLLDTADYLAETALGDGWTALWLHSQATASSPSAGRLLFVHQGEAGPLFFELTLPADPTQAASCQRAAEAVLGTVVTD